MSFPRYPKYKASGVNELGELPEHWDVKPLKHFAGIDSCGCYGVDAEEGEHVLPVATTAQIDSDGRFVVPDMPMRGFTPAEIQRYGCGDGDILVVKSSGSATNIISGKAGLVTKDTPPFVFSNFLMRIRPTNGVANPRFIYSLLRSHLTRQRVEQMCSTTTYPNLKVSEYTSAPLPLPPITEQTKIASFLDRETSKIDGLVGEQRRLIELLKEKRQAVISHAVTKGLNPHALLKPSGIEWLGDVPEHWEVGPVKRFFTFYNGRRIPLSGEERSGRSGDIPYYGASGIIDWIDEFIFEEDLVLVSEDGANLINRATPIAFVATGKYWVNNHAHILKPPDNNFAFWAERIESIDLFPFVTGSAQPKLTAEALNNLMIAVPPSEAERAAIQKHFVARAGELDALTAEAERGIELLQERRTALISAAVTGKINVLQESNRA